MEKRQEIEHLFNLYLTNRCTNEEVQLLLQYFNSEENEVILKDLIRTELESSQDNNIDSEQATPAEMDEIFQSIKKRVNESGGQT